jgi:hypothetical protein
MMLIGKLECVDVFDPKISVYNKRKEVSAKENQRGESASYSAISILVRMDLCEAMVKPSRNDDGILVPVFGQPLKKILNLRVHVNGRTVFVHCPIWTLWIVGLLLELAL